jgi:HSP20 family molecular chaperone IbpA
VKAELPGMEEKEIEVSLEGDHSGQRREKREHEEKRATTLFE